MEQIDFLEADSRADDHTLCIVLHKRSPAAKGNDRNKQGICDYKQRAVTGRRAEATGDEEQSALERYSTRKSSWFLHHRGFLYI